jgi:NAD-dependent dihydropyrimidine dehydrogenase PreA subunit
VREEGIFIAVEVDDEAAADAALAAKLADVCPVDIFGLRRNGASTLEIMQENIDECVLCRLCLDAAPPGAVKVLKRYDDEALLS